MCGSFIACYIFSTACFVPVEYQIHISDIFLSGLSYCLHNPSVFHWLASGLHREQLKHQLLCMLCSIFVTETSDCNSFFRTDLAVQILILPLSVNIDVETGTSLCDKSLSIAMSHEFACKQIFLL